MKKILLSLVVTVGVTFFGNSKVLTVSNNPNSPGQYTELQAACDAASSNDTIYVHASSTRYGGANLTKPLVLIGEGALPNQQVKLETNVIGINFVSTSDLTSNMTASGSKVYGINSIFTLGQRNGIPIGNFTFIRCKGEILPSGNSSVFVNQFVGKIGTPQFNLLSNIVVSNSILTEVNLFNVNSNNIFFRNCIIGNSFNINGGIVENNIFFTPADLNITQSNTTFNNNIFYYKTGNIDKLPTEKSNLFNVDPMFENPESSVNQVYFCDYNSTGPYANFKLKAGSPALTLGTDGTQVGIYGGSSPWVEGGDGVFRYHTMPSEVPYVTDMNILNLSVQENGTLNVNIKAKVQD